MFQTIDVDGDRMTVRSYSSEGEPLDTFQIEKKSARGASTASAGAAAGASGRR
jgi:hypothetical protein